jgi:hypothetical protein
VEDHALSNYTADVILHRRFRQWTLQVSRENRGTTIKQEDHPSANIWSILLVSCFDKFPYVVLATSDLIHQAQFALDVKADVLPLYEKVFDVAYPLPKLDTLVVSRLPISRAIYIYVRMKVNDFDAGECPQDPVQGLKRLFMHKALWKIGV